MKFFLRKCWLVTGRCWVLVFLTAAVHPKLRAQVAAPAFTIDVTADHKDWNYQTGEKPVFTAVVRQQGRTPGALKVTYTIGPEKMAPFRTDSVLLNSDTLVLTGFTLKKPGFLRCTVTAEANGKTVKGLATAAFEAEKIQPTIQLPPDFSSFWKKAVSELSTVPLDARVELLKDRSTETVNVYHISVQNIHRSRVFGILCVPKKPGKYPALLQVPGAGVRPYNGNIGLAEKGIITLEIGIHGVPVNLPKEVYEHLSTGALYGYPSANLDDKNNYYYKRVYLGCVRAVDFLVSHESYDGTHLAVFGGSQGGALSIVTAALDARIKYAGIYYPALSDVTGYLFGRAGGWPHLFAPENKAANNRKEKLETCRYYDVVNFARQLTVPGLYSWGYNDEVCPPTSMHAAYNVISAPKELMIYKETGHSTVPEQSRRMADWLVKKLTQ